MQLTLAPIASSPIVNRGPSVPKPATFAAWHSALHPQVLQMADVTPLPAALNAVTPILIPPVAKLPEAGNWERARQVFASPQQDRLIRLDQTVWDDEYEATEEWNTKPSKVENFFARYDKNQTFTTLVVVALLLLWIF